MNQSSKRMTKKQAEKRTRRMVTSVHVLLAVVAIIECILLATFTTFSWIESNSSLIIRNGPESSQVEDQTSKKMDISHQLNSTIDLNYTDDDFAPLNDFFSEVKYFEFAKATSSDGTTMFFPCRNNTYSTAGKYRKGDTVDYNTSYLYFDFILSNKGAGGNTVENRDVYFDETAGYTDIFTVTGGDYSDAQRTAIRNAMRLSITTQVSSAAPNTTIYATKEHTAAEGTGNYKSFDPIPADQSYAYDENGGTHDNNRNTWVATKALAKSVYATSNNIVTADKLFVAKKNSDTKVSVRIWFDVFDPDFRSVFGLDDAGFDYNPQNPNYSDYYKLSSVQVGIKFRLKTSGNDLRSIYFDDYTFTNVSGININHLTDENPNYSVWFYAWQPEVSATLEHPARTAGYYPIELERENTSLNHSRWTANTATASMMEYLKNEGNYPNAAGVSTSTRYQKSYFCYGDFSTKKAIYKWALSAAPTDDDFTFNAYSYQPNSSYTPASSSNGWSDCVKVNNSTPIRLGVGVWQDPALNTTMTLLKFKDMATAVTSVAYNSGDNFQIVQAAAISDNHAHYLVYANNVNTNNISNDFNSSAAGVSAAMYYDTEEQVFKSYVPTAWLISGGAGAGVSFTYTPSGEFAANKALLRWYNATPQATNGEYIFTALGYSNRYDVSGLSGAGYVSNYYLNSDGYLRGIGTWRDVELISFSTELIDLSLSANDRYFIGITDSYSAGYYAMIPDASNMTFSAYIPSTQGSTAAGVNFARYGAAKTTSSDSAQKSALPTAYWYSGARHNGFTDDYSTYYPVDCSGTATTEYTHGYWNLSVLVDGTYENLIYDTLTDGTGSSYAPIVTTGSTTTQGSIDYAPRANYGLLQYNNGAGWVTIADDTTDTFTNRVNGTDRYRFYAPAENCASVSWRWVPYAAYSCVIYTDDDGDASTVNVQKTYSAADTEFTYTHDVTDASSTGIYKVVTEAQYVPSV